MYKIGIIGHSPEHFSVPSQEEVKRKIKSAIDLLAAQYTRPYSEKVVFNVAGDAGVGLWSAQSIIEIEDEKQNCAYNLILPFTLEKTAEGLIDYQTEELKAAYYGANAITICNSDQDPRFNVLKQIIDNSNFTICFWVGKKQGATFEAINYGLFSNKMLLNGLDNLKMITNNDLDKHRQMEST